MRGSAQRPRPARRARRRRLPRRARADDHRRRPALDRGRPGGLDRQLRHASWIINAYLLVYVATMPLAGRLADLWGARRLFLGALVVFTVGSLLAGRAQTLDELICGRVVQAIGGGALVPVATAAASHLFEGHARPRALGHHRCADVPRHGRWAVRWGGHSRHDPRRARPCRRSGIGAGALADASGTGLALGLLRERPDRHLRHSPWPGPPAPDWDTPRHGARVDVAGALLFTVALGGRLLGLTLIGSEPTDGGLRPDGRSALFSCGGRGRLPGASSVVHGCARRAVPRSAPLPRPGLQLGRARLTAHRVWLRDGHRRRCDLRRPGLYGGPDEPAASRSAPWPGRRRSAPSCPGFAVRLVSLAASPCRALSASTVALACHEPLDLGRLARGGGRLDGALRLRVRPDRDPALDRGGRGGWPAGVRASLRRR